MPNPRLYACTSSKLKKIRCEKVGAAACDRCSKNGANCIVDYCDGRSVATNLSKFEGDVAQGTAYIDAWPQLGIERGHIHRAQMYVRLARQDVSAVKLADLRTEWGIFRLMHDYFVSLSESGRSIPTSTSS